MVFMYVRFLAFNILFEIYSIAILLLKTIGIFLMAKDFHSKIDLS